MHTNQKFTLDRSKFIGGSDVGPILGVSPYRSALDVWMEKTGKVVNHIDSLPLRFGTFAEEFVAREYAKATGYELSHDESIFIHPQYAFVAGHLDRLVHPKGLHQPASKILECKTSSILTRSHWGESGSDHVPLGYLAQVTLYMAITGIETADIGVIFGNSDFRIYQIERDQELESLVLEKAVDFWDNYVLRYIPPPIQSEADCQLLFGRSSPDKVLEANSQTLALLKRYQTLNQQTKVWEEELSKIKCQIMAQMQDAEALTHAGSILATWKTPKPSYRIDSKRLEREERTIFEKYKIASQTNRRFVLKEFSQKDEANHQPLEAA